MLISIRLLIFFFCAVCLSSYSRAENLQEVQKLILQPPPVTSKAPKTLIVYLSRTKNTEALAKMIQDKVGGELVALELDVPYSADYQTIVRQVSQENQNGYLPPLKTQIVNIEQHDVIFIGFPTWDMQLPPPIKSFLNQYSLNGKTIVPFNNNAGYGMGQSLAQFTQYCQGCQILPSIELRGGIERDGILFVMEGKKANQAKAEIAQWLTNLSANNPLIQQLLQKQLANQLSYYPNKPIR